MFPDKTKEVQRSTKVRPVSPDGPQDTTMEAPRPPAVRPTANLFTPHPHVLVTYPPTSPNHPLPPSGWFSSFMACRSPLGGSQHSLLFESPLVRRPVYDHPPRIDEQPAERRQREHGGRERQRQFPASLPSERLDDERPEEGAEIADAVHPAADGAAVAMADVDAGRPVHRHREVLEERSGTQAWHRDQRLVREQRQHEEPPAPAGR